MQDANNHLGAQRAGREAGKEHATVTRPSIADTTPFLRVSMCVRLCLSVAVFTLLFA